MKVISRGEAVSLGLKWYFTGKPCNRGHIAERQCANRRCRTCSLSDGGKWREKNHEKSKEFSNRWKRENREKARSLAREWRKKNAEKVSEYNKAYMPGWVEKNREKVRARNAMRRAYLLERAPEWLSPEHIEEIKQAYAVAKELEAKTGVKYHVDHIIPLRGETVSGLHVPWNLQVIPSTENLGKGNKL